MRFRRLSRTPAILLGCLLAILSVNAARADDKVKVSVGPASASAARPFELTVTLSVADGYHVQASTAKAPYIPTRVRVIAPRGFRASLPVYPPATTATLGGEKLAVYAGHPQIKVRVTPPPTVAGAHTFTIMVRYQACNDQSCLPPTTTTVSAVVRFGPAGRKADLR